MCMEEKRQRIMTDKERKEYCKDCERSIYGKYRDCDINIENNGLYVKSGDKCYCKVKRNEVEK